MTDPERTRIEALIESLDTTCDRMGPAGLGRYVGRIREAIEQLRADHPAQGEAPFPQPSRNDGGVPCGECHLRAGETCDVCGAEQGGGGATVAGGQDAPINDGDFIDRCEVASEACIVLDRADRLRLFRLAGHTAEPPNRMIEWPSVWLMIADARANVVAKRIAASHPSLVAQAEAMEQAIEGCKASVLGLDAANRELVAPYLAALSAAAATLAAVPGVVDDLKAIERRANATKLGYAALRELREQVRATLRRLGGEGDET